MPDHYGKKRQIDMDTPVDTGADVADALRDLTPEQFEELMSEMGQELFGPPDPRPTMSGLKANVSQDIRDPLYLNAHRTKLANDWHGEAFWGFRDGPEKITPSNYSGHPNSWASQSYPEFVDAYQQRVDPDYPEQRDAERKARMDALKSRVRERMSRFKM